jgi:hypothetical protein
LNNSIALFLLAPYNEICQAELEVGPLTEEKFKPSNSLAKRSKVSLLKTIVHTVT